LSRGFGRPIEVRPGTIAFISGADVKVTGDDGDKP
jgi:hypothetical protein